MRFLGGAGVSFVCRQRMGWRRWRLWRNESKKRIDKLQASWGRSQAGGRHPPVGFSGSSRRGRGFGGEKARKGGGRSCIRIVPLHDETDKTEMENLYEERLGTDRMLPLVFRMALPAVAAVCCTLFFAWTFPRILRQTGVR